MLFYWNVPLHTMIACMKSEIYETFKSLEKFWWGHGHTTKEV